jgi:hypothetical protein
MSCPIDSVKLRFFQGVFMPSRICHVCAKPYFLTRFNCVETPGNPSNGVCTECKLYARQAVALAYVSWRDNRKDQHRAGTRIKLSLTCQDCSVETHTQPHHESYHPDHCWDVIWLCRDCHRTRHNASDQAPGQDDLPDWLQPWTKDQTKALAQLEAQRDGFAP